MKNIVQSLFILVLFIFSMSAYSAVGLSLTGTYGMIDYCEGAGAGYTMLKGVTVFDSPSADSWLMEGLSVLYSGTGWTFSGGSVLSGQLCISYLMPYDTDSGGTCTHGTEVSTYYVQSATDSVNLQWLLCYVDSSNQMVVVSASADDGLPYYFSASDDPAVYYSHNGAAAAAGSDLIFGITTAETHNEYADFYQDNNYFLLLTSVDSLDSQHVYIHGGFYWGYYDVCMVPEPASLCLLGCGFVALLRRKQER